MSVCVFFSIQTVLHDCEDTQPRADAPGRLLFHSENEMNLRFVRNELLYVSRFTTIRTVAAAISVVAVIVMLWKFTATLNALRDMTEVWANVTVDRIAQVLREPRDTVENTVIHRMHLHRTLLFMLYVIAAVALLDPKNAIEHVGRVLAVSLLAHIIIALGWIYWRDPTQWWYDFHAGAIKNICRANGWHLAETALSELKLHSMIILGEVVFIISFISALVHWACLPRHMHHLEWP